MDKQDQIDMLNGRHVRFSREATTAIERLRAGAAILADRSTFGLTTVLGIARAIVDDAETYAAMQQGMTTAREELHELECH